MWLVTGLVTLVCVVVLPKICICEGSRELCLPWTDDASSRDLRLMHPGYFNGSCYGISPNHDTYLKNHSEASAYCFSQYGGHLAKVSDNSTANYLRNLMISNAPAMNTKQTRATLLWIGATYNKNISGYVWPDGETVSQNRLSLLPFPHSSEGFCGIITWRGTVAMEATCSMLNQYICQYGAEEQTSVPANYTVATSPTDTEHMSSMDEPVGYTTAQNAVLNVVDQMQNRTPSQFIYKALRNVEGFPQPYITIEPDWTVKKRGAVACGRVCSSSACMLFNYNRKTYMCRMYRSAAFNRFQVESKPGWAVWVKQ